MLCTAQYHHAVQYESDGRALAPAPGKAAPMDELRLETEMNRGFLQVLVLVALERPLYGYGMLKLFEDTGYGVEENSLYPLLRRLEARGLVASRWEVESDRPKKFYQITAEGRAVREQLLRVWQEQHDILTKLREARHE